MAAHGPSAVAAILVAAGSGERLRADVPKAFVEVGGQTLAERAVRRFGAHPSVGRVVLVVPADRAESAADRLRPFAAELVVVPGGATRQASVAAGLAALAPDTEYVLVHDVARAFVPDSVIDAVVAALADGADAVVPVVAIADTVRRGQPGAVLDGVVDRSTLVAVQTPQGFRRAVLVAAHERAETTATDDAALVEALGHDVVSVPGAETAFKITTPHDLARAEFLAAQSSTPGGMP
ncbi:MAG: 2-C-methyl-D-erythritol 4-phosphate cytidylyltransferase [Pseudonocardiales bacterium]|jgi:2-C-methyl-D-erythritol 4-phosphate cytidylyltransferase|nr:2-C-methyl-D-erythritol 4-phosphate cytidylyltransferase [Pseudonocardiales bacterium]